MSVDEPDPTPPARTTPPPAAPPDWANDLRRTIEELPGKLKAVVTDEDKASIAETVHGLFEGSGAFQAADAEKEEQEGEREVEKTTTDSKETPPAKGGKMSRFAQWFAGE